MANRFVITAITYLAAGMLPVLIANYIVHPRFIGGIWAAVVIGLIASFFGGLVDSFVLGAIPDLIPIAEVVDAGLPVIFATIATLLFALVSRSNSG